MKAGRLHECALILAGGLGTRLQNLIPDRPKVLAPIAGRPFLDILVRHLADCGIGRLVLLLGSRYEQVVDHVQACRRSAFWPSDVDVQFSIEPGPLGTGGAVKFAERFCDKTFFLLNGDTYFDFDAETLLRRHRRARTMVTLSAARVSDAGRYGSLDVTPDGRVARFREKDISGGPGLINAGVYVMEPGVLAHIEAGRPVSLESEVFPALLSAGQGMAVSVQDGSFFDIGTPSRYHEFVEFCQKRRLSPPAREE
jgi:NDP-sugar pyrophosphorylase family protein